MVLGDNLIVGHILFGGRWIVFLREGLLCIG